MSDLKDFSTDELVNELEIREYNFLEGSSDWDLTEEFSIRGLSGDIDWSDSDLIDEVYARNLKLNSDNVLDEIKDKIYNLYKSYICNDPNFESNLKKFFSETLNINVVQ